MNKTTFRMAVLAGLSGLPVIGCDSTQRLEAEGRALSAERQVMQLTVLAATRDSLLSELMETTSFITDINNELTNNRAAPGSLIVQYDENLVSLEEYRARMLARIEQLRTRLDASEARLALSRARLHSLSAARTGAGDRMAAFDAIVIEYREIVADQRTQIDALTGQVAALTSHNRKLVAEKAQLTEAAARLNQQVAHMERAANTGYYIVGTKQALLEKGVAMEVGGARVLGVGPRTGQSLAPARQLQTQAFAPLAIDSVTEILLPDADREYTIVSQQNLAFLDEAARDGTFKGRLRITDPAGFWAPSKYLIIVEL